MNQTDQFIITHSWEKEEKSWVRELGDHHFKFDAFRQAQSAST